MKNQPASPAKTGILLVGAGGSLALAYWSISQAMAPPPHAATPSVAQAVTPAPLPPARPLVTEVKGEELPSGPSTQSMIARTPAARAVAESIGILSARKQGNAEPPPPSRPITGEAALAPGADPFLPYAQNPNLTRTAAAVHSAPLPGFSRQGSPTSLTIQPGMSVAPTPPPPPVEPELAGTLLGDRPSAVFRIGKRLTTVAAGDSFDGWTVVRVDEGNAIIRRAGTRIHLYVGMVHSASPSVARSTDGRQEPTGHIAAATPEEIHNDGLPRDIIATTTGGETAASTSAGGDAKQNGDENPVSFTAPVASPFAAPLKLKREHDVAGTHVKFASVEEPRAHTTSLPVYHPVQGADHVVAHQAPAATVRTPQHHSARPTRKHNTHRHHRHHRRRHRLHIAHAYRRSALLHESPHISARMHATRQQLAPARVWWWQWAGRE